VPRPPPKASPDKPRIRPCGSTDYRLKSKKLKGIAEEEEDEEVHGQAASSASPAAPAALVPEPTSGLSLTPGAEPPMIVRFRSVGANNIHNNEAVPVRQLDEYIRQMHPEWISGTEAICLLDCTGFPHYQAKGVKEPHSGRSIDVMNKLLDMRPQMKDVTDSFFHWINYCRDQKYKVVDLITFCHWGKHRSVAVCNLLYLHGANHCSGIYKVSAQGPIHTNQSKWGGGCYWRTCPQCSWPHWIVGKLAAAAMLIDSDFSGALRR
jgi:hypothetical protein